MGTLHNGKTLEVKTDHDSIKHFLEQILSSEEKQKWVGKMLGYDLEMFYKKWNLNFVADAPSINNEDVKHFFMPFLLSNQIG